MGIVLGLAQIYNNLMTSISTTFQPLNYKFRTNALVLEFTLTIPLLNFFF